MKKNIIWWPAIVHNELKDKYGQYDYFKYSRKTWEYWCKKNDVLFVPFVEPVENDLFKFRPNWQKAIFVFDELERRGIEYDQICLADSTCMIKWNTPNFFELTNRKFTAWRDIDNMKWVYDSIQGYKKFFNNFELDQSKYVNSGFMIFNEKHKKLFQSFKDMYYKNIDELINLQDNIVKKGTEQTPLNYWLQINNIDVNVNLPVAYKLTHLHRKELFSYNWQLNNNKTPFFIKYGYNWIFNGIPKDQRTNMMKQVWGLVKHNYTESDKETLDCMLHKDTVKYTTSRKFKLDLMTTFSNHRNLICVELGSSQGQSSKLLSILFKKVYSIEHDNWNIEQAKNNCAGCDNIEFLQFDLYNSDWQEYLSKDVDVVFVDAGHQYYQVKSDIENVLSLWPKATIIFDDYGLPPGEVKKAIDEKVAEKSLQISKFIGESPETLIHAANTKFFDREGCICNLT